MFSQDRRKMRQPYIDAWQAGKQGAPLDTMQQMLFDVIKDHPEYHALLDKPEYALEADFPPEAGETNPFLHMSLHVSLREMIQTDRPAGVRNKINQIRLRVGDGVRAEHLCIDCLAEIIWKAQRENQPPDEQRFIRCLDNILKGKKR